jgi:hypothetical protein
MLGSYQATHKHFSLLHKHHVVQLGVRHRWVGQQLGQDGSPHTQKNSASGFAAVEVWDKDALKIDVESVAMPLVFR